MAGASDDTGRHQAPRTSHRGRGGGAPLVPSIPRARACAGDKRLASRVQARERLPGLPAATRDGGVVFLDGREKLALPLTEPQSEECVVLGRLQEADRASRRRHWAPNSGLGRATKAAARPESSNHFTGWKKCLSSQ